MIFLPMKAQIRRWRRASRKMGWGISKSEFANIDNAPPDLASNADEIIGKALFYGFGDDGSGNSDAVASGQLAWQYAHRPFKRQTWQCSYVRFDRPDFIRLRPGAKKRPKGFYQAEVSLPRKIQDLTVRQFRKSIQPWSGFGPEGLQFLIVTHSHLQEEMSERRLPFMAFADYDVAPHGFSDFYDAVQMFCSANKLGLGIGNINQNYPLFAIPKMRY